MRIYNGTNAQVDLPYTGGLRITVEPKSVSGDILSSTTLITTIVTAYTTDEIALIVSGPFELNICANIPTAHQYVVQSLDEAIRRFTKEEEVEKEEVVEEKEPEVDVEKSEEVEKEEVVETGEDEMNPEAVTKEEPIPAAPEKKKRAGRKKKA